MKKKIVHCEVGSPAFAAGIREGMCVSSLNGQRDFDILDYMLACADDSFTLAVEDGESEYKIINRNDSPIGITFEEMTIDPPKKCANKCVFCFMDQMPAGLRDTLYFKDDDYRLSFLCGNYVTLTNVSDEELERVIKLGISPLNISVHTSDPELREEMMHNKRAGRIMSQLRRLKEGGIEFNVQLVLCPGINDGESLQRTLSDMLSLLPELNSLSCVPVGLTKYRENLPALGVFDAAGAGDVIDTIAKFRVRAKDLCGKGVFCASDEFFIVSGRSFPAEEYYNGYDQYENGVGMYVSLIEDIKYALTNVAEIGSINADIVTGVLGQTAMEELAEMLHSADTRVKLKIQVIKNNFFGGYVTASGLTAFSDIIAQLKAVPHSDRLILPSNMLNDDELSLDDLRIEDIEAALGVKVYVAKFDGSDLFEVLHEIAETEQENE